MNKEELSQLTTLKDLEAFRKDLLNEIRIMILSKINPLKDFLTPKEFSHKTGIPYSTVVHRCKSGKLKARQDEPNCTWLIHSSELSRYNNEADENALA